MEKNIWLDGIMGLVVGDALGIPVQFLDREEIRNRPNGPVTGMESRGTFRLPAGSWSDDSSMTLATLASIIDNETIDPEDIMKRFVKWEMRGDYTPYGVAFDEGRTCMDAIYDYMDTKDITTCGGTDGHSNGNGSLMRILPACIYYQDKQKKDGMSIEEAIAGIHTVSGLTHNHLRSKMCCGFYYFIVRSVIDVIGTEFRPSLQDSIQEGMDNAFRYYHSDKRNLRELSYLERIFDLSEFKNLPEEKIKSSGYVIDTIEAATWCLVNTSSYEECMLKAVNLGEDTDTIAAVAGGIAGLYYGYRDIPEEWLAEIKKREWIEGLCEEAKKVL